MILYYTKKIQNPKVIAPYMVCLQIYLQIYYNNISIYNCNTVNTVVKHHQNTTRYMDCVQKYLGKTNIVGLYYEKKHSD